MKTTPYGKFTATDAQRAVTQEFNERFRARPQALDLDIVDELEKDATEALRLAPHSKMEAWCLANKQAIAQLRKDILDGPAEPLTTAHLKKLKNFKLG